MTFKAHIRICSLFLMSAVIIQSVIKPWEFHHQRYLKSNHLSPPPLMLGRSVTVTSRLECYFSFLPGLFVNQPIKNFFKVRLCHPLLVTPLWLLIAFRMKSRLSTLAERPQPTFPPHLLPPLPWLLHSNPAGLLTYSLKVPSSFPTTGPWHMLSFLPGILFPRIFVLLNPFLHEDIF